MQTQPFRIGSGQAPWSTNPPTRKAVRKAALEHLKPCPMCGGMSWHIPNKPIALPVHVGAAPLPVDVGPNEPTVDDDLEFPAIVTLPCICGNCGYMALFHYDSLRGTRLDDAT